MLKVKLSFNEYEIIQSKMFVQTKDRCKFIKISNTDKILSLVQHINFTQRDLCIKILMNFDFELIPCCKEHHDHHFIDSGPDDCPHPVQMSQCCP